MMQGCGGGVWGASTEVFVAHRVEEHEGALLGRHKFMKRHVLSEGQEIALNLLRNETD